MFFIVGLLLVFLANKSMAFHPFTVRHHILSKGMAFKILSTDWYGCSDSCSRDTKCISYNYWVPSNSGTAEGLCELNRCGLTNCGGVQHARNLVYEKSAVYQQLRQDRDYCSIEDPRSCADVLKSNRTSGLYTITPAPGHSLQVYCDQTTDGGGWVVIQRRFNGTVDFYRSWDEYKRGFGNKEQEFWLGLESIHLITTDTDNEIRFDLKDCNLTTAHAQYSFFKIGDESDKYKLYLGDFKGGVAGDSFSFQKNMNFSTFDDDNDHTLKTNCAKEFKGAWWYNNCHYSNLNGEYKCGHHDSFADGLTWKTWKMFHYSLRETEMKIRPTNFKD